MTNVSLEKKNKDEYYDNLRENKNNDNTKNNYRRIDEIKNDKDEEKKNRKFK